MFRRIDRRLIVQIDWLLLFCLLSICAIGLVVIYSGDYDQDRRMSVKFIMQARFFGVGLLGFFLAMVLNTKFWKRASYPIFILCCGLLVLVLKTGINVNGATRWLDFGSVRVQPSEFMKAGIILALARLFSSDTSPKGGYRLLQLVRPVLIMAVPTALVLKQPDLGTGIVFLAIGGSMLFAAGISKGTLIRLALISLVLVPVVWEFGMKDYQRQRVLTFLYPEQDPLGSGYHAIQSKIAVGSGSVFGKGFQQGTQTQLRFLPEQTTDFAFSVLAEEWGFVGTFTLVALYSVLVLRLFKIASTCADEFSAFVAFGVASMAFWHMIVNIGMVIGIMPVVGITLTIISYGGSSVVTFMCLLGIVSGVSMRRYLFA